jgi:hypothetical protein
LTPEELASNHPRLYHITRPQMVPGIKQHGLLSANGLLTLFELPPAERQLIGARRRSSSMEMTHPVHGKVVLTDNGPLSEAALSTCLDDGLRPADWMLLLNRRVFFWVDEKNVDIHLRACIRNDEKRIVLMFDTLGLIQSCFDKVELAAINTGSTMRSPSRRGLSTFVPASKYTYREWQSLRGKRDRIKELTVLDGVRDVEAHLLGYYDFPHL